MNSISRTLLVAALIVAPSGLPFSLVGIPPYLYVQAVQLLLTGLVLVRLVLAALTLKVAFDEFVVLAFFIYAAFVSYVSATFFYPQDISSWLPGLLIISPLSFLLVGALVKLSLQEAINGFLLGISVVCLLLFVDHFVHIGAFDQYVHYASRLGSARRIVLLHNESAFAATIMAYRFANSRSAVGRALYAAMTVIVLFVIVVVSESRLVAAASLIAICGYFVYKHRSYLLLPAVITTCVAIISTSAFLDVSSVFTSGSDGSVAFREIEIYHFGRYFDTTGGLGFGLMSLSPTKDNILSNALLRDGALYGSAGYWLSLVDVRMFAALFQFGYPGLLFVVVVTFVTARRLILAAKRTRGQLSDDLGCLAAGVVAFCISPLPLNLFTVENTVMLGGFLWCVASLARRVPSSALALSGKNDGD